MWWVVNKQIKKGLLLSLRVIFLIGEYLAKLQARTWLSRALFFVLAVLARREKCMRQPHSCLQLCQILTDLKKFTRTISNKSFLMWPRYWPTMYNIGHWPAQILRSRVVFCTHLELTLLLLDLLQVSPEPISQAHPSSKKVLLQPRIFSLQTSLRYDTIRDAILTCARKPT